MIELKKVSKKFKDKTILKDISIKFESNNITCLIGESGCGKTTILKMINRLIKPTSGDIFIDKENIKDKDVIKLRRSIGYVIQQTGLFPHMTIKENVELISRIEKRPKKFINERIYEVMDMVELDNSLLERYPTELSGGQQQRIGIARAFFTNPEIILMDEPFSALDPITRTALQDELLQLQEKYHKTIIFVTHDMDEAIKLADKIAIMDKGEIIQYGTPEEILKRPKNEFVKEFVGNDRIWTSPQYIKISDIMMKNPITARPNHSCFYCLNKMKMHKVDSLLIIGNDNKFLGILYAEILNGVDYSDKKADEFIERDNIIVNPQDSIVDVLEKINENKSTIIPVVNDNNVLVGYITKGILLTFLSQQFVGGE